MSQKFRFAFILVVLMATVFPVFAGAPSADKAAPASTQAPQFVVYYFHGNVRCATCRKLEAYTDEAIKGGFETELKSGTLAFRVVNVDEDQNKHFVNDFQMTNKSVVVAEYREGKVIRFENLNKIWQKVRDKEAFLEYVQTSTRDFIGKR